MDVSPTKCQNVQILEMLSYQRILSLRTYVAHLYQLP